MQIIISKFSTLIFNLSILLSFSAFALEELPFPEETVFQSPTETYNVIHKVGEGFFGNVYEVNNSKGLKFALKAYKPIPVGFEGHYFADAEREFLLGQRLQHPNIIKSFDYFAGISSLGFPVKCVILEYVEGEILWLVPKKAIDGRVVTKMLVEFVDALKYAYDREYIHFDLHRGNVMVTKNKIKIIDLASFTSQDELIHYLFPKPDRGRAEGEGILKQSVSANFAKNPELMAKINNIKAAAFDVEIGEQGQDLGFRNIQIWGPFLAHYFSEISKICVDVLEKSELSRNRKINKILEITRLYLNCTEDAEEERGIPLDSYLDQLSMTLRSP